jgi:hypothetical protein
MSAQTRHLSSDAYFPREYGNNLSDDFGTITPSTPEELRAAGMNVCAHAQSAEEAVELLSMLGLVETWREVFP